MTAAIAPVLATALCASGQVSKTDTPVFSKHAVYAYMGQPVRSPDGLKSVSVKVLRDDNADDFPTDVVVRVGKRRFTSRINFGLNAEVLWSPDSTAFAVTGSRDGANGLYKADVFILEADRLKQIRLSPVVWRAFGHPVKCGWPEYPNVGAVTWLADSTRLVVAAQIIGHSVCDSNFTFKAYEISIPSGEVLRSYGQLKAKSLFREELGPWLVAAPDECIHNPKSCWVATNHPEQRNK